jgi:ketosteroid isomerase-like protein
MKLFLERSLFLKTLILMALLFFISGCQQQQNTDTKSESEKIDLQKVRSTIEALDKQFSKDFYNGDSVSLANYYSSDAKFGSLKGKEILSAWGSMIRNSIKDNIRNLLFTTTAFTGDSIYAVELGKYEMRDDKNNLKERGRYAVVWKEENGEWKIYRDIGL